MKFFWFTLYFLVLVVLSACGDAGTSAPAYTANGSVSNFTFSQSGTSTSPWGDGSSLHRPAMAVKLTPTSYPVTITSVTVCGSNQTGLDQAFNVHGYYDLSLETEMFSPVQSQIVPDTGSTRFVKTIDIPPTTITSGSFYLAVEWLTKPLNSASGSNTFFLGADSHNDHPNSNFIRFTGTTWRTVESVIPALGDLGIIANYGSYANKNLLITTIPANGATGVSRNLQEIEVHFSNPMTLGSSVLSDGSWPLSDTSSVRWSEDQKTFFISRTNPSSSLPAGTTMSLTFNPQGHPRSFMDVFGNTLGAYTVTFTTGQ